MQKFKSLGPRIGPFRLFFRGGGGGLVSLITTFAPTRVDLAYRVEGLGFRVLLVSVSPGHVR